LWGFGRAPGVVAANFITAEVNRSAVAVAGSRVRIVDFFWNEPSPGALLLMWWPG
jgi:hypothetical protein